MTLTDRSAHLLASVVCVAAVGGAAWTQYQWQMQPCPWCILQRILFLLLAALNLLAVVSPWRAPRRGLAAVSVIVALGGMAAALWQHFVAAKSQSCALTFADRIINATGLDVRWPELFEVRGSCADAVADLLGVSYDFWSLALFALLGVWSLTQALRRR